MNQPINWDQFAEDFATAPAEVKKEVTLELLPILARQRALGNPLAIELGCRLYGVDEAWEADMLARESDMVSVNSLATLRDLMKQRDAESILITQQCDATLEDIRTAMHSSPYTKTLFWFAG